MPAEASDQDLFEGTDETGVVTVVVDRRGLVADVVLAASWQDKVRPRELGTALCAAANAALAGRLAERYEHPEPDFGPEFHPESRPDAQDAEGNPAGRVARGLRAEIAELLVAFDREIVTYQRELSEAVNATAGARSRKGAVEVTMGHGRVITVDVDPSWAKSATRTGVRAEALGAFTAAGERLAAADPSAVTQPPALARLARLAADPSALTKELGL